MALVPKVRLIQNSDRNFEIRIPDNTGAYSVDNTGGYDETNTNNPNYSDIEEVHLRLMHDSGLDATFQIDNNTTPWPNDTGLERIVKSSDFGMSVNQVFPDGKYVGEFRYIGYDTTGGVRPADTSLLAIATITEFFYGSVECCVNKMWVAALKESAEPCDSDAWKLAKLGQAMLDGIINSIECKNYERAQIQLEELETLCATNKLSCGC